MNKVSFPGLGIGEFTVNSTAFSIGSVSIKWYAICICLGLIVAFLVCDKKSKFFGVTSDDFLDLVLITVPLGLVSARIGYVLMDLDSFDTFYDMIAVWNGGLAIYGGLIGAFITLIVVCRIKKINVFSVFDLAAFGIIIGQTIGRWGNFFNIEVYGVQTNLPWRMGVMNQGVMEYVHPLFLYESLWNLIGFVLILAFLDQRKFKGEVFLWYTACYGLGRGMMEGLRDAEFQLTIGALRINQCIAFSAFTIAVICWVYFRFFKTSVHFESGEQEKNMTLKELHELREQQRFEKQSKKYDSQFSDELADEALISEDEYQVKKLFDSLENEENKNADN